MLDGQHRFDAARDDDIGHARLDHHRGVDDRLQSRAAAAIELIARHLERQTRGEPRPVPDARRFAIAIALREDRSEEHTSELQSIMRISDAVFCLKKKSNTLLI